MDWDLFIDESGMFSAPSATVVVCGALVPKVPGIPTDSELNAAFKASHRWAKLPHHAADLGRPAGQLAAWVSSGRPSLDPCDAHRLPTKALRALQTLEKALREAFVEDGELRDLLDEFLGVIDEGGVPRSQAVHAADDVLMAVATGPHLHTWAIQILRSLSQEYFLRLAAGVKALLADVRPRPAFVVAGEGADALPFAFPSPPDHDRRNGFQDRYLRLLSVATERALALLRDRDGADDVLEVHVSYRDIEVVRGSGKLDRYPMRTSNLQTSLARGAVFSWPRGHKGPRAVVGRVERYEAGMSPWFVVADHAAWRVRQLLKMDARGTWSDTAATIGDQLPFGVEARCAWLGVPLPAVAAEGHARRTLALGFAGDLEAARTELGATTPGWARGQASQWLSALGARGAKR